MALPLVLVDLVCARCSAPFQLERYKHRARQRQNPTAPIFCGRSCASRWRMARPGAVDHFLKSVDTPAKMAAVRVNALGSRRTPEQLQEHGARSRRSWVNQETRDRHRRARKRAWSDPALREAAGERSRTRWADPAFRERVTPNLRGGNCVHKRGGKVFDSSWEADVFEWLSATCPFPWGYHAETVDLEDGHFWNPDFVVEVGGNRVLLELKGHPRAVRKWEEYLLPRLRELGVLSRVSVLIIDAATWKGLPKPATWKQLLSAAEEAL